MAGRSGARIAGLFVLGSALSAAASGPFPYSDLPPNLPERRPGLWEIRTEGTLSSGPVKRYEERSRLCVDAVVDHALYRKDLDAKHMTVAIMDGRCDAPAYAFDGHALSMTMQCTSGAVDGGPRAETSFASTTTYAGPDSVTVEHRRVDHGHIAFESETTYRDTMTRIGDCEAGQKPGDRVRIDSRMDGSEVQKSMRKDNILDCSHTHHKLMEDILAAHRRLNESGL